MLALSLKSSVALAIASALAAACGADRESTGQQRDPLVASDAVAIPATTRSSFTATSCTNAPGPYITLDGDVTLGGFGVRLIFRNNQKGTHEHVEEITNDLSVVPLGEKIVIPKQPSQGGSGGNPFIWAQLLDGSGKALTDEMFLGRCVQGLSPISAGAALPGTAELAGFTVSDCTNNPGPYITLDGQLRLSGLTVRIIFRNNDNPVGGPHETVVTQNVDMPVIPPGWSMQFPKQPVLGGVGGNPWIYLQFIDGQGNALSGERLLGRCVQLAPGN